jgi:protein CpxP
MSHFTCRIAVAALLGAGLLAAPLTSARAATATAQPAAAKSTTSHQETVEQRITSLHKSLKITPDEEANWNAVAQVMRDNAAAMDKLATEREAAATQPMTAVDDLNEYQKFAQAHVDGLKNLIAAFDTLYGSMPDPQKKIADQVFGNFRHQAAQAHG